MSRMLLANALVTVALLSTFGFGQAKPAEYHSAGELKQEFDNLSAEIKGKSVDGGTHQVLALDDVVHIPAGTPHQLLLEDGADFRAVVIKIRE